VSCLQLFKGYAERRRRSEAHIEKEHPGRRGQMWQDTMEEVKVQRWVNDTRGTYWIVGSFGRCETSILPASKTSYEQVMEALEAEEDMEFEEYAKRNEQEDDAKGLDESTSWLRHHTKWPTRFEERPLNILAITKKPPSTSPKSRRAGLTAGTHHGIAIRWDEQFEERLHTIMVALRQMLERSCQLPAARHSVRQRGQRPDLDAHIDDAQLAGDFVVWMFGWGGKVFEGEVCVGELGCGGVEGERCLRVRVC
jgi:hypothetical protein